MVLSMSRLLARSVDMLVEGTSLSHQGFELNEHRKMFKNVCIQIKLP